MNYRDLPLSQFRLLLAYTAMRAGGGVPEELAKSFSADTANLKPESFGPTAYIETWKTGSPGLLTTSRLLPRRKARQLLHTEGQLTGYGDSPQNTGFGGERGPGVSQNPLRGRLSRYLKPQHQRATTGMVGNLEMLIPFDDGQGVNALEQDRMAALMRHLRAVNVQTIHADTNGWRGGASDGLAYKGLIQQIREGTDGTEGTSRLGSHVFDAEGSVLDVADVGAKFAAIYGLYGSGPNVLIMTGQQRQAIASAYGMTSTMKYELNASENRPIIVGQTLLAIQAAGRIIPVLEDVDLMSQNFGLRPESAPTGAPTGLPTIVSVAVGSPGGGETSLWDADSDGADIWYAVSEVNSAGIEGTTTRHPAGTSYETVAAGQKVTLTLRASSLDIQGLRIYRGKGSGKATLIGQVANSSDGSSVTFTDLNEVRPNTDYVLALCLNGPIFQRLMALEENRRTMDALSQIMLGDMLGQYLDNMAPVDAAVMLAYLGDPIMRLQLGVTGLLANDEEIFSVHAPFVRGAKHCAVWANVGLT